MQWEGLALLSLVKGRNAMTDATPARMDDSAQNTLLQKAVIVAVLPAQSEHVVVEAARYARLLDVPLVVVHVDVTRFVTYEDPDGYVHSAPIDLNLDVSSAEFERVRQLAEQALDGSGVTWAARQLVGDPALSIKQLANKLDAQLIVVGTRDRGIGESIREFFTGSVAARLSHRQHRPVLVVPLQEPIPDEQEDIWTE